MWSAVKLRVLLMMGLSTARSQSIQALDTNRPDPQCAARSPAIRILSIDYDALQYTDISANDHKAAIEYESQTSLEITCLGVNATALVMTKDGVKLQTTTERETAIVWTTGKLDLQQSEFVCTDTETNCQSTAILAVMPACPMIVPNSDYFTDGYILQYGNTLTFSCYGSPATRLSISKDNQTLPARNASDTEIEWFERTSDLQASDYICTDVETGYSCRSHVRVVPHMYVKSRGTVLKRHRVEYNTGTFDYRVQYSDDVEVFCSGPRPVTLIDRLQENKEILVDHVNASTVKTIVRSYVNGVAIISCVDSEHSEYISTIKIRIYQ